MTNASSIVKCPGCRKAVRKITFLPGLGWQPVCGETESVIVAVRAMKRSLSR